MIKTIAIWVGGLLLLVVAAALIYAASKPDSFRVQRSASIKAPPEKIFAELDDLHRHGAWSPWEKKDPAMKRTHSGASKGKGAVYEWDGNKDVGKGRMAIVEIVPPTKLVMTLDFIAPFEAHNMAEFVLVPKGDGTTAVTWAIYGPSPFLSKVMGLFLDMDIMIGKEFETGLANLKALAEK